MSVDGILKYCRELGPLDRQKFIQCLPVMLSVVELELAITVMGKELERKKEAEQNIAEERAIELVEQLSKLPIKVTVQSCRKCDFTPIFQVGGRYYCHMCDK